MAGYCSALRQNVSKASIQYIDAHKIAVLLWGGMFPLAYVYPAEMRATRDLLRRRCHLVRKRAELSARIHHTTSQLMLSSGVPFTRLNPMPFDPAF
jgi:transposase